MIFENVKRKKTSLNMTPLIDVIFLLLMFFMLTSKFNISNVLEMNVSEIAEQSEPQPDKEEPITITLTPKREFMLAGHKYQISMLRDKIQDELAKSKNREILLLSGKGISVQDVVSAMGQIKAAGGNSISLAENK